MTSQINIKHESKQVEWIIANDSPLSKKIGTCLGNFSFTFANSTWLLTSSIWENLNGIVFPRLCLNCIRSFPNPDVTCSISIKRSDGSLANTKNFTSSCRFVSFSYSVDASILQKNKISLLPSDVLTIVFNLTIYDKNLNEERSITLALLGEIPSSMISLDLPIPPTQEAAYLNENSAVDTLELMTLKETDVLSKNFKDLFLNGECCDAVLQVKDKEFKVHRTVLIARSPVFAAMFKHDTCEKQTGIINVPDCDTDTFQQFLVYLYSGELEDISLDTAIHLYRTSDKYVIKELNVFCTKYMMQNLTIEKICDIVILADQYDEMDLFYAAQNFFNENLREIVKTDEWESLMKLNYRLANKLIIKMSESAIHSAG